MSPIKSDLENTFKSKETEEFLDIIFYRPFGYFIALAAKKAGLTPNVVTISGVLLGIVAGHLFYYNNMSLNIAGIVLVILSQAFDSADGQLARMTQKFSRFGRILDGFGDNLTFLSIYLHICFRLMNEGFSPAIFILAVAAGLSHSCQSALGDYGRNLFTYFSHGKSKSEIEDSERVAGDYGSLSWKSNFFKKLMMRFYLNYTVQQEFLSGSLIKLYRYSSKKFGQDIPQAVSEIYRQKQQVMIKYYNILTTNTRLFVLFIVVLAGYPWLYFVFELTIMNLLLLYVALRHKGNGAEIMNTAVKIEGIV